MIEPVAFGDRTPAARPWWAVGRAERSSEDTNTREPMTQDLTTLTGRALDAEVARVVFGWPILDWPKNGWPARAWNPAERATAEGFDVPAFASDMRETMKVVMRMRELTDGFKYNLRLLAYSYGRTYAHFGLMEPESDEYSEGNGEHATEEAICLAALAALTTTPAPVTDRA